MADQGNWEPGCCYDRRHGYPKACIPATCMRLPDGTSCGDCAHLKRCRACGFTQSPASITCDFFPRRFCSAAVVAETDRLDARDKELRR